MTMDTRAADAAVEEELPPEVDEEQSSGQEGTEPSPQQPSQRERELEARLTKQGRELSEARRTQAALTENLRSLQSTVATISETQSAAEQREARRREQEMEAYLASLPEDKRLAARVDILTKEVQTLRVGKTAAQPARTAAQPVTRATPDEDPDVTYMRERATAIIGRAQKRYGVTLSRDDLSTLPESAWGSEDDFHDAVYDLAAQRKSAAAGGAEGEDDVTKKGKSEDEDTRIARVVRQTMGVASPASPKAAAAKGKAPTDEEVKKTVSTYNSAQGPKANIARLKEQRARMGTG